MRSFHEIHVPISGDFASCSDELIFARQRCLEELAKWRFVFDDRNQFGLRIHRRSAG